MRHKSYAQSDKMRDSPFVTPMTLLARKPLLLAFLLVLPLWIVLGNFIVAASAALLLAFLIAMCHALYTLKKSAGDKAKQTHHHDD